MKRLRQKCDRRKDLFCVAINLTLDCSVNDIFNVDTSLSRAQFCSSLTREHVLDVDKYPC